MERITDEKLKQIAAYPRGMVAGSEVVKIANELIEARAIIRQLTQSEPAQFKQGTTLRSKRGH